VPLWATQGFRHLHQGAIWQRAEEAGAFTVEHIEEYLEPEAISIEKRYRAGPTITPNDGESVSTTAIMFDMDIEAKVEEKNDLRSLQVAAIKKNLITFTHSAHISASSNLQEEQERELAPEIEGEHHLYRPPRRKALSHSLHRDLLQFFAPVRYWQRALRSPVPIALYPKPAPSPSLRQGSPVSRPPKIYEHPCS